MVVSLLRTWRRPLSMVFSLITTVKSTPISSYLQCNDTDMHTAISQQQEKHYQFSPNDATTLYPLQLWIALYLAFSFSIDVGIVSRYPGQAEILASINSCRRPSQTYKTVKNSSVPFNRWAHDERVQLNTFVPILSLERSFSPSTIKKQLLMLIHVLLTCLCSIVAPLLMSRATLTGANTGCNFRTWN